MKKKKEENVIKCKILEIVKCEKMKILVFNKISEKDNIIILENDKYFIAKKCSY
jgi:hypothetical protein